MKKPKTLSFSVADAHAIAKIIAGDGHSIFKPEAFTKAGVETRSGVGSEGGYL